MFLINNMKKSVYAILMVICLASAGHAGEPQFRIESYIPEKFSDFQWRIDGNISLEGYRREVTDYNNIIDETIDDVRTLDAQKIEFTSEVNYFYESLSRFLVCSLITRYNLENTNPYSRWYGSNDFDPGVFVTTDGGVYLFSDFFFSATGAGGWQYEHNQHDINPDTHFRRYTIDGTLALGWGRYHEGRFAASALNIINELNQDGIIIRGANYAEMYNLTEKVRYYRLQYRPDERLHKIAALQELIGFLVDRGILNNPGPYGYLLIQDVWDFFPNEARFFGWRLRAGFGLNYIHTSTQTTDEHISEDGIYTHKYQYSMEKSHQPYLTINGQYSNPLSLRWHLDVKSEYRYYLNAFSTRESMSVSYSPSGSRYYNAWTLDQDRFYKISILAVLRYFLDGRTSVYLTASYVLSSYHKTYDTGISYSYEREGILRAITTFEYRLSIPTTLQTSMNIYREDAYSEAQNGWHEFDLLQYYFSARLVHYVF